MVQGEECQYPVDLFYAKSYDEPLTKDIFAAWLDEQFQNAHGNAREASNFGNGTALLQPQQGTNKTNLKQAELRISTLMKGCTAII